MRLWLRGVWRDIRQWMGADQLVWYDQMNLSLYTDLARKNYERAWKARDAFSAASYDAEDPMYQTRLLSEACDLLQSAARYSRLAREIRGVE